MPLLKLQVSVSLFDDQTRKLMTAMSGIVAKAMGKPESYMMVTIEKASISMGGKVVPAAYADVRGIGGFNKQVNARISKEIGELLKKEIGVEPEHVYLTFTDVAAQNWGWKGDTFG